MSDDPPDYPVGYTKPPLRSLRFRKGQSGNPEVAGCTGAATSGSSGCSKAALDTRDGRPLAPATDAAPGDRRSPSSRNRPPATCAPSSCCSTWCTKTELAAPPPGIGEDDPRAFLLRELNRLAAAQATWEAGGTEQGAAGDSATLRR